MDDGFVYLICDASTNCFKIGVTRDDLPTRLHKLQTGNSTELFIKSFFKTKYPFRLETMLHKKYGNYKVLNEWFNLKLDDVVNFKKTCTELEMTIRSLKDNVFFMDKIK